MVTRIIVFLLFVVTVSYNSLAQQLACGTPEPTKEQISRFKELNSFNSLALDENGRIETTTPLAIAAHVIRRDDATGGLSEIELNDAIDNLNNFYSNAGLSFFLLTINYIDETKYFDFITSDEGEITSLYNFDNTINIYFANSVGDGDDGFFCGYAYFPGGPDVILMDNSCTVNGSTLPHEVGHFFALYHTHGTSNSELTDELVTRGTGANCDSAGDQLCDTEADPKLTGKVNSTCQYTGDDTDANGDVFTPDPSNIMSYSLKACRDVFTDGQFNRINAAYTNNRNYLLKDNFIVDFSYDIQSICTGEEVSFTSNSINADSYAWVFEGGTPATSNAANPVVTYETSGVYNVELTITSGSNSDVKAIENGIEVTEPLSSSITEEAGSFEETDLEERIINSDNGITWEKTTSVSTDGESSMYMNFFGYNSQSQEDYLVIAVLNTSVEKSFELTFDYAYSAYDATYFDGLAVAFKGSCESTWETVFFKEGDDLQTTETNTTSQFVPSSEDWKQEVVAFEVPADKEIIEIAFKAINGYGNNLYVDNYSVSTGSESAISITSIDIQNASCPDSDDGAISILATGNGPFEYSIDGTTYFASNEFINLTAGDYEVTVKNNAQNSLTETAEVSFENDYPDLPVITELNGVLSVSTLEGQDIQWFLDGEMLADEISNSIEVNDLGSYTVEVSNGACATLSDPFDIVLGLDDSMEVLILPNPAIENIRIEIDNSTNQLPEFFTITDLAGKVISQRKFTKNINVSDLKSGIYLIQFRIGEQNVVKRFVKQ